MLLVRLASYTVCASLMNTASSLGLACAQVWGNTCVTVAGGRERPWSCSPPPTQVPWACQGPAARRTGAQPTLRASPKSSSSLRTQTFSLCFSSFAKPLQACRRDSRSDADTWEHTSSRQSLPSKWHRSGWLGTVVMAGTVGMVPGDWFCDGFGQNNGMCSSIGRLWSREC